MSGKTNNVTFPIALSKGTRTKTKPLRKPPIGPLKFCELSPRVLVELKNSYVNLNFNDRIKKAAHSIQEQAA